MIDDFSDDYAQFLKQLGLAKVTWIGYWLGSMIGMRLAFQKTTGNPRHEFHRRAKAVDVVRASSALLGQAGCATSGTRQIVKN